MTLSDPDTAERAVRGVDVIYHVGPTPHPREREMGLRLGDAAGAARVGHFVFSSVLHSIVTDLVQHEVKRDVEEHLLASDLLQPPNYMLPLKLRPVFERGVFELFWSLERKQPLVDLTDVAVQVLVEPDRHAGATYELVAPGRYTAHDLGAIIQRVLGRSVDVREIDADTYLRAWTGGRAPALVPHQARVLRAISARYSAHDFVGNSNVLTWLLVREPTGLEEYVRREWDAYRTEQPRGGSATPC